MERKKAWTGIMFISPWLLGFILFFAKPMIQSLIYTLSKIEITSQGFVTKFVGKKNYVSVFLEDPETVRMIVDSIGNMVYEVSIIVIFSIFIAIVLNQKFKGRLVARAVFVLPIIVSSGVLIVILKEDLFAQTITSSQGGGMFQTTQMRDMLIQAGIDGKVVNYFTEVVNRIFDLIWKSGVQILLFLAALQSVPRSLYEASDVEGATPWQSFWEITFPMISPFILVNVIYSVIDSFTDYGNPVMRKVYDAVIALQYELSSTLAVAYFLIVLLVIGLVTVIISKKVFYMED